MENVFVVLENIRSLYNIGAIFRTCSFFGIYRVILLGYSGKNKLPNGKIFLHEEVNKTALGAEKDLEILFMENTEELKDFAEKNFLKIISFEQNTRAARLKDWKPENNCLLVFGNEVEGVSSKMLKYSHEIIEISRYGKHNSLNVTTACGIVLYYMTQKL